jgi:hypothetical protein
MSFHIFESKEEKRQRITEELDEINRRISRVTKGISVESLASLEEKQASLEKTLLTLGSPEAGS